MKTHEHERAAYMAGDYATADLYARIDALQRALGDATAENVRLRDALEWAAARMEPGHYKGDIDRLLGVTS